MVVVAESVEPSAENLPDQQTPARLQLADVAARVRVAPAVVADRLVAELRFLIECEAIVAAGELAEMAELNLLIVGIHHEIPCGLAILLCVTSNAAPVENRPDVAKVFDVGDFFFVEAQPARICSVPALRRLVTTPAGDERCFLGQIPQLVMILSRRRLIEIRRGLAVGMAAATVVAHFAWPQLVPGLRHVQDDAALVERLEGERGVSWNLREKARVRMPVRIDRLFAIFAKFSHWDLAEDAQSLGGMIVESAPIALAALPVSGRLHREYSHGVDVVVRIKTGVGALVVPVDRHAVAVAGKCVEPLPRIVSTGILSNHFAIRDSAVRIGFALVEARRSNDPERRPLRQRGVDLTIVSKCRQSGWFLDAVDALVGNDRPRPAFVVVGVVFDQQQIGRLLDDRASLSQVDAPVELRQILVLVIDWTGRINCQQMVVRSAARVGEFANRG